MRQFFRRTGLRVFLVICACIALGCPNRSATVPVEVDTERPVEYVLIHKHHFLLTGNEALIIADQTEIQELISLLGNNERNQHACGYHWVFRFQHSLVNASILRHNQDCQTYRRHNGKIQRLFDSFFSRINEQPSHFLYNLRIDASYEPEVVASLLMKDGAYVFFFRPESRLPHIRLRGKVRMNVEKDGDYSTIRKEFETRSMLIHTKMQEVSLRLKKTSSVQHIEGPTYIEGPVYRVGDTSEDKLEEVVFGFIVYFSYDQQLEGMNTPLEDVEIVETIIPVEYTIQLASPVPLNAEQMLQLQETYDFIHAIEPFNSG